MPTNGTGEVRSVDPNHPIVGCINREPPSFFFASLTWLRS